MKYNMKELFEYLVNFRVLGQLYNNDHINYLFKLKMQWSNLNQQIIEQFFQNSNSPSNAQISLNFTRTSRQMPSNQKPIKDISPTLQIPTHPEKSQKSLKSLNPQSDLLLFVDHQISQFDSWINNFNKENAMQSHIIDSEWQALQKDLFKHQHHSKPPKQSTLQNIVLSKMDEVSKKVINLSYPKPCQHCALTQRKILQLQTNLHQLQINLQTKTIELARINEKQIQKIGSQLSFQVENRLLNAQIDELINKNFQLSETIQTKNCEISKLNEEINKLHFQKSTFLSKTKALQTRAQELEKSKSFLMSAAKNSTSYSEFNITNQAMLNKSQNQTNIDTTLIYTNQFSADRPTADDYCAWFEKIKQVYLEKYKKEQKQHLKKFPELKNNEIALKAQINNFKKGSARYQVARSWNNIVNYVSKNKENFLQLISNEVGVNMKIPLFQVSSNINSNISDKENIKTVEFLQEQLKKSKKKAEGHLSQIQNLNQQLMNIKKTLLKQKQEKTRLSRQVHQMQEQIEELQQELQHARNQLSLSHKRKSDNNRSLNTEQDEHPKIEQVQKLQQEFILLEKQLCLKSQQLQKAIENQKAQEQIQLKLSQSIKQSERLLYKERLEKIHYFRQSLSSQSLTTACRIRAKSITEKKFPSVLREVQSRIYVDKEKLSYRFDMCEQPGKQSKQQIYSLSKKILMNSVYEPSRSFILSMGSTDSQFNEYFRGENGLIWSLISELFKIKLSEKRFLQIDLSFSVIQITNFEITDLISSEKMKKVTVRKQGNQGIIENCSKISFQNDQQAVHALNQAYSKQQEIESNLITIIELSVTQKRNKQKYTSKLFFGEMNIDNRSDVDNQMKDNLIKDTKALWNLLKGNSSKESIQLESNRVSCLLSECLNENGKNLLIMNVSPTELHRQQSIYSLNYGSSLKYLSIQKPVNISTIEKPHHNVSTQKPSNLIRYNQKNTPEGSVQKLRSNSSHSLNQTPTLTPDAFEDKSRSISKHRNSSSEHTIYGLGDGERRKRTINRMSIC